MTGSVIRLTAQQRQFSALRQCAIRLGYSLEVCEQDGQGAFYSVQGPFCLGFAALADVQQWVQDQENARALWRRVHPPESGSVQPDAPEARQAAAVIPFQKPRGRK